MIIWFEIIMFEFPNYRQELQTNLLVTIPNYLVFVTGLSYLSSCGKKESYYVHTKVESSSLILGIVVEDAVSQHCDTGSANNNSHNSTVEVRLSGSCFALAFCYCFGLAGLLSRRWRNSSSYPSCFSSCFSFQPAIVTFESYGYLYFT